MEAKEQEIKFERSNFTLGSLNESYMCWRLENL